MKLTKALLTKPWAVGPILPARHSSAHRSSLAWDELSCSIKHSSPDMVIKRVKVWWPFIFANEFTAVGGNKVLSQLFRVSRCTMNSAGKCNRTAKQTCGLQ